MQPAATIAVCRTLTFFRDSANALKTVFTKLEQSFWIKIEVARSRTTQECFQGLREAYGDPGLPYRTVARWVKAFRKGRDAVQENLRTGRPHVMGGSPGDVSENPVT